MVLLVIMRNNNPDSFSDVQCVELSAPMYQARYLPNLTWRKTNTVNLKSVYCQTTVVTLVLLSLTDSVSNTHVCYAYSLNHILNSPRRKNPTQKHTNTCKQNINKAYTSESSKETTPDVCASMPRISIFRFQIRLWAELSNYLRSGDY